MARTKKRLGRTRHVTKRARSKSTRPRLDAFTRQYAETALWSTNDESNERGGEPLDDNYDVSDIATPTLRQMVKDCKSFRRAERKDLEGIDDGQAGHDFWLTRNGHGAGFWDRGLGAVGDRLTKACRPYGSFDLYVGDDGHIHGN